MKAERGFASDNCSGVHPVIMEAIVAANSGHVPSYGADDYTAAAVEKFRGHLGADCDVHLLWGGTAANVVGFAAVARPYQAVICAETAHINVHECGATEMHAGCKLLTLPSADGKITPEQCERYLGNLGNQQQVQPRVVSISQPTERGTVYGIEEIEALASFARDHGMLVHLDGARLANAAVHLGVTMKETSFDAGVDLLSFGGTKNGMLGGEAVVFAASDLAPDFTFVRKQGLQLASKMRFIAVQFLALLTDGLIYDIARHGNEMAQLMAEKLRENPDIGITQPVQSNAVFATVPPLCVERLLEHYDFHVVDESLSEVRLMHSFDTTVEDVTDFAEKAELYCVELEG